MTVQDIFPAEISLGQRRGARLIDVREPAEYECGHLPGAVNIPLAKLRGNQEFGGSPVVLVCARDSRSAQAAALLLEAGHADVANLLGGTLGWMQEHRPVDFLPVEAAQSQA
ncbi:rhodanese-like domain-containing protein (plasmid) [Deinococcus psychrotolerans]|uniref:Rhodanese-like domain-containing protein n=1 Tax=Deinococcus psychrotolerans TaxID=2489213 RepID=A0A3G8YI87_9DEIO|nr:rhodanese-like domain-containing protein [Deinococcus psychrotolerans]AZI44962.1 rhodanese-like domain-containing protein [Deinococcus psychrotolerans]